MVKRMTQSADATTLGQGVLVRKGDRAILVKIGGKELWIPFSVVHDDSDLHDRSDRGEQGTVVVASWWAEKKQAER